MFRDVVIQLQTRVEVPSNKQLIDQLGDEIFLKGSVTVTLSFKFDHLKTLEEVGHRKSIKSSSRRDAYNFFYVAGLTFRL